LFLLFDEKCLKGKGDHIEFFKILPTVELFDIDVTPNENISTEASIEDVGRFDVFLTAKFKDQVNHIGKLNIIFELKIDSKTSSLQSRRYSDWLYENHPKDVNFLIYILPKLLSSSKATVGDGRWYCLDYQLLNDKLLIPILEHPNLNEKVKVFVIQYIKNLKISYKGIKMAITNEEKRLALELYEKYSDVFDSIFDVLQEENVIDFSISELASKGRKTGRIAIKIDGKVFEQGC